MASPLVPVAALGVTAYANNAYNSSFAASSLVNVKPLLFAAIAGLVLDAAAQIPPLGPAATLLGWTAFVGYMVAGGGGAGTPVGNLSKIANQGK